METEATAPSNTGENTSTSKPVVADDGIAESGGGVEAPASAPPSNDDDDAADKSNNAANKDDDANATAAGEKNGGGDDAPAAADGASTSSSSPAKPQEVQPNNNNIESNTTSSEKKRSIDEVKSTVDDEPLPTLPLKRARTAYFIFADDKRETVKQKHQGEGVAVIAKAIGQLWSALQPTEKEVYETQAAKERQRVSRDTQRLKDAGLWPEPNTTDNTAGAGEGIDDDTIIFPIGRIRKICKLDPEVKGMSKESALLITKATELFCTKLGKECVTMAQMQNRRKLLPEDVVEVCSIKERFMFLKPDLVDLRKRQVEEMSLKEKENGKDGGSKGGSGGGNKGGKAGEESGAVNTLESYFGKVRN
ncbi:hypothetical protein ACHAXR_009787 [Thalassiosira sp. AJA248-18]